MHIDMPNSRGIQICLDKLHACSPVAGPKDRTVAMTEAESGSPYTCMSSHEGCRSAEPVFHDFPQVRRI